MSFLEEIASLTTVAPSVDPELVGWADQSAFLSAKATDRPYHILDDADAGIPASRSEIFGQDGSEVVDEEAAEALSRGIDGAYSLATGSEEDSEEDSEEMESDGSGYNTGDSADEEGEDQENDEEEDMEEKEEEEEELKMVQQSDPGLEEEKRSAVKFQMGCWDKLVQMRLKLQPCLQQTSRLPLVPEKRSKYMSGDVAQSHRQKILINIQSAIDKLMDIQDTLFELNPAVSSIMTGKKKAIDEDEIPSDTDEEEKEDEEEEVRKPKRRKKQNSDYYMTQSKTNGEKFESYKTETLLHWYEQTKIVAKKSSFMNKEITVLDQIQHILSDKDRLVTRSTQNRSGTAVFGTEDVPETHSQLFNDDDFYQQLLREIIDKKMGNIDTNDPDAMGRQWVELEKLKVKSKKKVVDTKASKGRKVRYDVHSKLLGFMAPITLDTLSDQRQDELFSSLFASNL